MKIYVTGGYVRDTLLKLDPIDMDFVVVGATEEDLIEFGKEKKLNLNKVGADFPVYLDKFRREWALARKERKTKPGYKGFECTFDPSVTLQDDLFRRDITINAMARKVLNVSESGFIGLDNHIIDPYNGYTHLCLKLIRHVSNHFSEDPVRVLRVARFAARFNFHVDGRTQALIRNMAIIGELDSLVKERVWAETAKALRGPNPGRFFYVLAYTPAIERIFPNLNQGWNIDVHLAMDAAEDPVERYAIAVSRMPIDKVKELNEHLKVPNKYADFALRFRKLLLICEDQKNLTPENILQSFKLLNVYQDGNFLFKAHSTAEKILKVKYSHTIDVQLTKLTHAYIHSKDLGFKDLTQEQQKSLKGVEIQNAINSLRLQGILDS